MKSVLLRAPLLSFSGYGTHSRQVARWLFDCAEKYDLDITTELLQWGHTPWITDTEECNGLIGEMVQASSNVKPFYDVSIQLQLPNEWNPFAAKFNIGMTAGVETDKCNPAWISNINQMSLVIVPSEFTRQTFLDSGKITTKIAVIPEAFPDVLSQNDIKPLDLQLSTPFNFLIFGQLTGNNPMNDRKNIPYTMKWIAEQFQGRSDIGVVIKTSFARQTQLDKLITTNILNRLLTEIGASNSGPKFHLLHGPMSDMEIAGLYHHPSIKAMLSLHRGEGFGLGLLEAAASGLPVISTGWSAPTEFLGLGKYTKIAHTLEPIHESRVDNAIFIPGAKWAWPNEMDAKQRMVKFVESSDVPKQWAKDLQGKIRENYSFNSIAKHYDDTLGPVLTGQITARQII